MDLVSGHGVILQLFPFPACYLGTGRSRCAHFGTIFPIVMALFFLLFWRHFSYCCGLVAQFFRFWHHFPNCCGAIFPIVLVQFFHLLWRHFSYCCGLVAQFLRLFFGAIFFPIVLAPFFQWDNCCGSVSIFLICFACAGMGFTYQMLQFQEERMAAAALVLAPLEKVIQQTADYCRQRKVNLNPVLQIQDVYPGSRIRIFSIPDPHKRI